MSAPPARGDVPTGVLVVDKPQGPTSHDIVAEARRLYGTREVGHAGTLDPMATGVLLLLFGEACKLSSYLTGHAKRYVAEVRFGRSTLSLDAEGEVTREVQLEPGWASASAFENVLQHERERTSQVPPAISAIKLSGMASHKRARLGQTPKLSPRPVRVHDLKLVSFDDQTAKLELVVSKGYYVRALARDIGDALGVPAHLSMLRRIASGPFSIESAVAWPPKSRVPLLSLAKAARKALPIATLSEEGRQRAQTGKPLLTEHFLTPPEPDAEAPIAGLDQSDRLVALLERDPAGLFRVRRGMRQC